MSTGRSTPSPNSIAALTSSAARSLLSCPATGLDLNNRPTSAHFAREDPLPTLHPIPNMAAFGGMVVPPTSSERERNRKRSVGFNTDRPWEGPIRMSAGDAQVRQAETAGMPAVNTKRGRDSLPQSSLEAESAGERRISSSSRDGEIDRARAPGQGLRASQLQLDQGHPAGFSGAPGMSLGRAEQLGSGSFGPGPSGLSNNQGSSGYDYAMDTKPHRDGMNGNNDFHSIGETHNGYANGPFSSDLDTLDPHHSETNHVDDISMLSMMPPPDNLAPSQNAHSNDMSSISGYGYMPNQRQSMLGTDNQGGSNVASGMGFGGVGAGGGGGTSRVNLAQMVARKQNVACDACRGRKVKCNRQSGEDNCESCKAKGLDCTSHYVSQIASYRKNRQATMQALSSTSPGNPSMLGSLPSDSNFGNGYHPANGHSDEDSGMDGSGARGSTSFEGMFDVGSRNDGVGAGRHREGSATTRKVSYEGDGQPDIGRPSTGDDKRARPAKRAKTSSASHRPPPGAIRSNHNAEMEQDQLIAFLLSPTYIKDPTLFAYVDDPLISAAYQHNDKEMGIGTPLCEVFFDPPSPASGELVSPDKRKELALDLVETFFQIVHIRHTVLVPEKFRRCFAQPFGPDGPVSPAILALVLAWGAKYSEHPIINEDRHYHSRRLENGRQRCRIAQMLASRAQQILEADKLYRRPSKESLQALLLMNVLAGSNMQEPRAHTPYWEGLAVQHVRRLGYNRNSVLQVLTDNTERAQIGHLFWYTFWSDGFSSVYYRTQPAMTDDGHDVEPMHTWTQEQADTETKFSLLKYLSWHGALGSMSRLCRTIASTLWLPRIETFGIPLEALSQLLSLMTKWRDEQLIHVGVPSAWPSTWDFLAASEACAVDCNFHCLWIVLASAVEEFGIMEAREDVSVKAENPNARQDIGAVMARVRQEALDAALRISALAGVLASNNYLRLDPDILFHSVYTGGWYLANLGRKETEPCIKGLRQLGLAFEEVFDRVEELEDLQRSQMAAITGGAALPGAIPHARVSASTKALPRMNNSEPHPRLADLESGLPPHSARGVIRGGTGSVMANPWFNDS